MNTEAYKTVQKFVVIVTCQVITVKSLNMDAQIRQVKDKVIVFDVGTSSNSLNIENVGDEFSIESSDPLMDLLNLQDSEELTEGIESIRLSDNKVLNLCVTNEDIPIANQPISPNNNIFGTSQPLELGDIPDPKAVLPDVSQSEHCENLSSNQDIENNHRSFSKGKTKGPIKSVAKDSKKFTYDSNKLLCEICRKTFKHQISHLLHKATHSFMTDTSGLYVCNMCQKTFTIANYLIKHKRHTCPNPEFICNLCNKRQVSLELMRFHSNYSCPAFKTSKFHCAKCDRKFVTKNGFQKHKRKRACDKFLIKESNDNNSNMIQYQCEQCGKIYANKNSLGKHLRSHQGIKNYECNICKKLFADNHQLSGHYRKHTKEKPYLCSLCGKSFCHAGHLSRHVKQHEPCCLFKCSTCDKTFVDDKKLTEHLKRHSWQERKEDITCETLNNH